MAVQQPLEAPAIIDEFTLSPSSFKARKSLPHPPPTTEHHHISGYIGENLPSSSPKSLRRANAVSMPGSFPLNGLDASLPPTPPRHGRDQPRNFSSPSRSPHQNGVQKMSHRSVSHSTPLGARSPPTPDATPPTTASLDLLATPAPAPVAFSPSSRADSFRTAREDQWSSDDGGDDGLHEGYGTSGAVKAIGFPPRDASLGLGFERDDDSTPTPKKLKQKQAAARMSQTDGTDQFNADAIPDREWDTNMMRNVTVRRKKRPVLLQERIQEDEERVAAREIVPKLVNGSSEDDDGPEPLTPSFDHFAQTMSGAPRSDEKTKRFSGSSHTSTVLEAFIVPTSPQRRRTLRHTSKNFSLRSDDGSSRPSSNHASLASDELSMSQLNDKLRTEHNKRINGIYTPDLPSVLPAVPLKHHPESRSLRLDSVSSSSSSRRRASDGTQSSTLSMRRQRTTSGGYSVSSLSGVEHPGRLSYQPGVEPIHVKYDPAAKQTSQKTDASSNQLARAATRRALQRLDSSGGTIDARPTSFPREPPRPQQPVTTSMVEIPTKEPETLAKVPEISAKEPEASTKEPEIPAEVTPEAPTQSIIKKRKDSVDLAPLEQQLTTESIPRVSFDNSTIAPHEMHRASNASSNLRADSEHANARHIFAQSTPFSQISEHEIGEANAVNIYPHNNNSLLVVQQVARPSGVQKQTDESLAIPGWPSLTVQPATPPQVFSTPAVNVDSPLKNPRRPPQPPQPSLVPPVINIHPATPETELDRISFSEKQKSRNSDTPVRSLSLTEKARRYSDNVMRPLITRTSSLRRSYYRRSRFPRQGAPRDSLSEEKQESLSLHPFWQPRGFWDEFSDSDSDWGEPEPGRRLPAGGDTTELGEPRGIAKVLDRARSKRGFLIGNSLGLERAGTNKKKPVIQLPVGLGQRTSGRVVMKRNGNGSGNGSQGTLHTIASESARSVRVAKRSVESLRHVAGAQKKHAWNPRNWQVHYVGVSGVRDMWRQRQAQKRRQELKGKIGVRYSVEIAPTNN